MGARGCSVACWRKQGRAGQGRGGEGRRKQIMGGCRAGLRPRENGKNRGCQRCAQGGRGKEAYDRPAGLGGAACIRMRQVLVNRID